ncbi:GNAT family N-acetyltransferase [Nanchangia anserum]|uniref:GNAT family N-acetyltransferase n=1 Tax=Nanchangia anserum TaxID=2692125 RepID=A0A8I0GCF1_9ACTO|nr:GNAT family N-acetyltransferase [Nanchangia anserum]MBD3689590.1 GNAT family N-acetyltransferase [Nanchangia anserum]QOX81773.1 GNAT family N-acetyltransferase [Nanchangia anserum]
MVSLSFAESAEDRRALAALDVPAARFTTPPQSLLASVDANPHMKAVAIRDDEGVAGYFAVETGPSISEVSADPADVLLRMLAVARSRRRRGIAREMLSTALEPFLCAHYPTSPRVLLLVSVANWGAHRLYLDCGFRDTGFARLGPWGRQRVLARTLGVTPL